jgi:hypothetical protein
MAGLPWGLRVGHDASVHLTLTPVKLRVRRLGIMGGMQEVGPRRRLSPTSLSA